MSKIFTEKLAGDPIEIILEELESGKVLNRESLIFREKYDLLVQRITRKASENSLQLQARRRYREEIEANGWNTSGCFIIDGARGYGKSTLMRAVRAALVNENPEARENPDGILYPLADVDPTALGREENFFLYILGRIYSILDSYFQIANRTDGMLSLVGEAMDALRKMSGGLQRLMDTDEALKRSANPEFFLEECIDKCADSSLLREKLNELLSKVSKIVGKEVFLVTVDDVDLDFSKCAEVLEYVRKYMQTPRLIFLFAGDMHLFTHIVRGMYVSNFREKQLKYDTTHETGRQRLLGQLSDQYLQKFFPADYRIQIDSLQAILNGPRELLIKSKKKESVSFNLYLQEYLSPAMNWQDINVFRNVLAEMPLRSVFMFLRYLGRQSSSSDTLDAMKYIEDGLTHVISSSLVRYNIDEPQVGNESIKWLQKTIFRFFSESQQWNSDLSMVSTVNDSAVKQVVLYLSCVVRKHTQGISSKLSYWCACFPVWQAIRDFYMQTYDASKTQDLVGSCLKMENSNWQTRWADLACGALAPKMNAPLVYGCGTIGIFNEDRSPNKEEGREERLGLPHLVRTFSDMNEKGSAEEQKFVMAFNACLCRLDDAEGSYYYLSVFHLLMQIAAWLNLGTQTDKQGETQASMKKSALLRKEVIRILSSMRVVPSAMRLQRQNTSTPAFKPIYHAYQGMRSAEFVDELCIWIQNWHHVLFVSSSSDFSQCWEVFMAKCAEFTAAYQINYEQENHSPRAGVILQQYMSAVEIALSRFQVKGESKLLQCISDCPLWKVLMNPPEHCIKVLNAANIGDFVNMSVKAGVALVKKEYDDILAQIDAFEQQEEKSSQRYAVSFNELQGVSEDLDNKNAELKMRQEIIERQENEVRDIEREIEQCLAEEEQAAQFFDLLQRNNEDKKQRQFVVEKNWELLKAALRGEPKSLVMYEVLDDEAKRVQHLLERARTKDTRQKHELTLELIHRMRSLLVQAEREHAIEKVWRDACEAKNNMEMGALPVLAVELSAKSQGRKAKARRTPKEKRVSAMNARREQLQKLADEAEIACKLVSLKYERMKKETQALYDEWQDAKNALLVKKKECDAAKLRYENAKKPDEEVEY